MSQLFGVCFFVGVFIGAIVSVFTEEVEDIESRCPYNDFWHLQRNPFR